MIQATDVPEPELTKLLEDRNDAFSLDEGERGETSLVEMEIDTGDARPRRQRLRRMPFAVRTEVTKQLKSMQKTGVIQTSNSPWASPVVMVRKKDSSHRFCVDYRELYSVTRQDSFLLPRIDDLLDQLGQSQYFSALDLASGYWQIRLHPGSIPKTAFVTPQGIYKFRVMPFGLTNAPSVFQRLIKRVFRDLNPEDGPDFVSVYIDDVLVFSITLEKHLQHLRLVMDHLLKLKPSKCRFLCTEVEYLGHVIMLKTNPRLIAAVKEFPAPRTVREIRQFLGLCSYYRHFIPLFSRIAQPLHDLTKKGVEFKWNEKCQEAFRGSWSRIISTPGRRADTSRRLRKPLSLSLSPAERRHSITELETLAVVWSISHFHSYLYGHSVVVYTDHAAVRAVLESPNPSAKHARWWTQVYGSGIRNLKITYRPGKSNTNADALSRSPYLPAPAKRGLALALALALTHSEPVLCTGTCCRMPEDQSNKVKTKV